MSILTSSLFHVIVWSRMTLVESCWDFATNWKKQLLSGGSWQFLLKNVASCVKSTYYCKHLDTTKCFESQRQLDTHPCTDHLNEGTKMSYLCKYFDQLLSHVVRILGKYWKWSSILQYTVHYHYYYANALKMFIKCH